MSEHSVTISVAMLEIYNELVRDLLGGPSPPSLDVSGVGPGELQAGAPPCKQHTSYAACLTLPSRPSRMVQRSPGLLAHIRPAHSTSSGSDGGQSC